MDIINQIPQYAALALTIMGALGVIVKVLAKAYKITPGTPSTDVFTATQRVIHKVQKVLGFFAADTAADERRNDK